MLPVESFRGRRAAVLVLACFFSALPVFRMPARQIRADARARVTINGRTGWALRGGVETEPFAGAFLRSGSALLQDGGGSLLLDDGVRFYFRGLIVHARRGRLDSGGGAVSLFSARCYLAGSSWWGKRADMIRITPKACEIVRGKQQIRLVLDGEGRGGKS